MSISELPEIRKQLRAVFTPGKPVDKYRLFQGRKYQAETVYDAIVTDGMHVILYGERGVGKTSLAQVMHEFLEREGIYSLKVKTLNCDRTDDFTSMWQKVFREMSAEGQGDTELLDAIVDKESIAPDDVRFLLSRLDGKRLIIFDEFDKLPLTQSRILFADTIKNLADHDVKVTIMLVGVADTVDELLAEHRSIERSLRQVRVPRMTSFELEDIVKTGFERVDMYLAPAARQLIVLLSQGLPFYTHYLCLYSGLLVLEQGETTITAADVADCTAQIVGDAHHILTAYLEAVSSSQKNNYPLVLLACALAETDAAGFFSATNLIEPLKRLTARDYKVQDYQKHLKNFCKLDRGRVLVSAGATGRVRYRFSDALMQPYVILDGIAKGMLPVEVILNAKPSRTQYTLNN
jgi:Cdc6-like AAA superfamily ATPase